MDNREVLEDIRVKFWGLFQPALLISSECPTSSYTLEKDALESSESISEAPKEGHYAKKGKLRPYRPQRTCEFEGEFSMTLWSPYLLISDSYFWPTAIARSLPSFKVPDDGWKQPGDFENMKFIENKSDPTRILQWTVDMIDRWKLKALENKERADAGLSIAMVMRTVSVECQNTLKEMQDKVLPAFMEIINDSSFKMASERNFFSTIAVALELAVSGRFDFSTMIDFMKQLKTHFLARASSEKLPDSSSLGKLQFMQFWNRIFSLQSPPKNLIPSLELTEIIMQCWLRVLRCWAIEKFSKRSESDTETQGQHPSDWPVRIASKLRPLAALPYFERLTKMFLNTSQLLYLGCDSASSFDREYISCGPRNPLDPWQSPTNHSDCSPDEEDDAEEKPSRPNSPVTSSEVKLDSFSDSDESLSKSPPPNRAINYFLTKTNDVEWSDTSSSSSSSSDMDEYSSDMSDLLLGIRESCEQFTSVLPRNTKIKTKISENPENLANTEESQEDMPTQIVSDTTDNLFSSSSFPPTSFQDEDDCEDIGPTYLGLGMSEIGKIAIIVDEMFESHLLRHPNDRESTLEKLNFENFIRCGRPPYLRKDGDIAPSNSSGVCNTLLQTKFPLRHVWQLCEDDEDLDKACWPHDVYKRIETNRFLKERQEEYEEDLEELLRPHLEEDFEEDNFRLPTIGEMERTLRLLENTRNCDFENPRRCGLIIVLLAALSFSLSYTETMTLETGIEHDAAVSGLAKKEKQTSISDSRLSPMPQGALPTSKPPVIPDEQVEAPMDAAEIEIERILLTQTPTPRPVGTVHDYISPTKQNRLFRAMCRNNLGKSGLEELGEECEPDETEIEASVVYGKSSTKYKTPSSRYFALQMQKKHFLSRMTSTKARIILKCLFPRSLEENHCMVVQSALQVLRGMCTEDFVLDLFVGLGLAPILNLLLILQTLVPTLVDERTENILHWIIHRIQTRSERPISDVTFTTSLEERCENPGLFEGTSGTGMRPARSIAPLNACLEALGDAGFCLQVTEEGYPKEEKEESEEKDYGFHRQECESCGYDYNEERPKSDVREKKERNDEHVEDGSEWRILSVCGLAQLRNLKRLLQPHLQEDVCMCALWTLRCLYPFDVDAWVASRIVSCAVNMSISKEDANIHWNPQLIATLKYALWHFDAREVWAPPKMSEILTPLDLTWMLARMGISLKKAPKWANAAGERKHRRAKAYAKDFLKSFSKSSTTIPAGERNRKTAQDWVDSLMAFYKQFCSDENQCPKILKAKHAQHMLCFPLLISPAIDYVHNALINALPDHIVDKLADVDREYAVICGKNPLSIDEYRAANESIEQELKQPTPEQLKEFQDKLEPLLQPDWVADLVEKAKELGWYAVPRYWRKKVSYSLTHTPELEQFEQ